MHEQRLTDRDGLELFRRAIVERSEEAWNAIHVQFRPLLISWSLQYRLRAPSNESPEDMADQALARAWAALSPERFTQFSNLAALLGYLRTCVGATVIDSSRTEASRERVYQKLEAQPVMTPEQFVVDDSMRDALWQVVTELVATEQERVVLVESFVLDLPPRRIFERNPKIFDAIDQVYVAKRNVLGRLSRCPALQRLREDLGS